MEITEIDALDHSERLRDIQDRIDSHFEQGDDDDGDDGDDELDWVLDVSAEKSFEDRVEAASDPVVQLRRRVTTGEVSQRAMELRLNHALLQVDALRSASHAATRELESLRQFSAESEEHVMLLEARLRDVSVFEQSSGEKSSLPRLRGELLHAAEDQMRALTSRLAAVRASHADEVLVVSDEAHARDAEIYALREQLQSLSDQLAQRTVLYSAHERRWREERGSLLAVESESRREAWALGARLQQLETQYSGLDNTRVELLLTVQQQAESLRKADEELLALRERTAVLNDELGAAQLASATLQAVVERLRGSSLEDIEREMAQELEAVRVESRRVEEEGRRQLQEAQALLATEAGRRDELLERLDVALRDKEEALTLLRSMSEAELGVLPWDASAAVKHRYEEVARDDVRSVAAAEPSDALEQCVEELLSGARLVAEAALSTGGGSLQGSDALARFRIGVAALVQEVAGAGLEEDAAQLSASSLVREIFRSEESPSLPGRIDEIFLTGSNPTDGLPTVAVHAEALALHQELHAMRRKERVLSDALKDQGTSMALVLKRAAEFEGVLTSQLKAALEKETLAMRRDLRGAQDKAAAASQELEMSRLELALKDEEILRLQHSLGRLDKNFELLERSQRVVAEALESERGTARVNMRRLGDRLCALLSLPAAETEDWGRLDALVGAMEAAQVRALAGYSSSHTQTEQELCPGPESSSYSGDDSGGLAPDEGAGLRGRVQVLEEENAQLSARVSELLGSVTESRGVADKIELTSSDTDMIPKALHDQTLLQSRRRYREKLKTKLVLLKSHFERERNELLCVVRDECASILGEARSMLERRSQAEARESVSVSASFSKDAHGVVLYPEMMSPEQTLQLVQSVLRRSHSLSEDEWNAMYHTARGGALS